MRAAGRRSGEGLRIGFWGVLGSGNWGNDGSLEPVVSFLRSRFPRARLGFMVMGPECLEARYDAPATHLQWYEAHMERLARVPAPALKIVGKLADSVRTWAWARHFDVVIVPGAGVLETTTPTRPWGRPYGLLMLALAGRLSGTRVAYVSVGASPIRRGPTQWVMAWAARLAHYRSYRDELSRDAMRGMGVDVSGDHVYPDLAFAMETPQVRSTADRVVGVGVMNYYGGNDDRSRADRIHDRYVAGVTRFVAALVDDGWRVRLFTGDKEDDVVLKHVLDATASHRADGDVPVTAEVVTTLAELMEVMTGVQVVVASRFHNVLAALKLAIPTLSISYAPKNDVLMESMGLGEFCHPAGELDVDRLLAQFGELNRRRDELVETMVVRNRENAEGVARQLDALADFVLRRGGRTVAAAARDAVTPRCRGAR